MADRTWKIVTPEAVQLDLDASGIASRVLAALIDFAVTWMLLWALITAIGAIAGASEAAGATGGGVLAAIGIAVGFFAVLFVWPVAIEVLTRGRSLGKMALGLRVVTVEGAPIRLRHATIRGMLGIVELLLTLGFVALAVALGSRQFRRLGDHLAGTVVVRDRVGGTAVNAVRFTPWPGWEMWASRLDATRLTTDDYRVIRSYLLRARQLPPHVRSSLGTRILAQAGERLGLTPGDLAAASAGGPELPLLAVAAAYQWRFEQAVTTPASWAGATGVGFGPTAPVGPVSPVPAPLPR